MSRGPVSADTGLRIVWFVRMWAVAHLIHLTAFTAARVTEPTSVAVIAVAFAVLLRPMSGPLVCLLAAAQIIDALVGMPLSPDHWMLIAFVNIALLVTCVGRWSTGISTVAAAFPAFRLLVVIAYAFAAVSKYNENFLDPVTSCARAIAQTASYGAAEHLGSTPIWGWSVMAAESSIPLLLLVPWTRWLGVRVGLTFHFLLSASPTFAVVDFTACLFALFLLFLPDEDLRAMSARLGAMTERSAVVRDATRSPLATAVVGFLACCLLGQISPLLGGSVVFGFAQIYFLVILVVAWSTVTVSRKPPSWGSVRVGHVLVALLLLGWCAQPYLGGRTTAVMTMFSGLQTEQGTGNHRLLSADHLLPFQDDLVVIASSNADELADVEPGQFAIPLFGLRVMAMDDPELTVVGSLSGETVEFGPGPAQRSLDPVPWWQERLIRVRAISVGPPPVCPEN